MVIGFVRKLLSKFPYVKKALKFILSPYDGLLHQKELSRYGAWLEDERQESVNKLRQFDYNPLISIITPTYNTPEKYFHEMVRSVISQQYQNWELVIVDDASTQPDIRELIKKYAEKDRRIKYKFLEKNHHIAGATNEAIVIASGEFISLFDHDDVIYPNTLIEIVAALNKNNSIDFIYTDEDKIIDEKGTRGDPYFKPDWNPDFLYSVNYITHFTTIRRALLVKAGFEDGAYNGAQDWELFFRVTRSIQQERIHHIPKVLYSWRVHNQSTAKSMDSKPYVIKAQGSAIQTDLNNKKYNNYTLNQDELYPGQWQLSFMQKEHKKLSILVTGDQDVAAYQYLKNYSDTIEVLHEKNFNTQDVLSKVNGEYLLIIDRQIKSKDFTWMSTMVGDASRTEIGFVVARHSSKQGVYENMHTLLGESITELVQQMGRKTLTEHYYRTTRYNIPSVPQGSVAMVEVIKLKNVYKNSLSDASRAVANKGYRNLYNPYVKV